VTPTRRRTPPADAGFALIEVLVSAIVIVITSAGVFGLLQAMTHASADERQHSQAYAIAQEDQARLRSMRLETLNHLDQERPVTLNGTTFTVHSTGVFINDKVSKVSCAEGTSSADYAQVTSRVTWPGMVNSETAKIESIVSPSNGSLDSSHGTLAVSVVNESQQPMAGLVLTLGTTSATTDAGGCVTFPNLPSGSSNLESSGAVANLVNTEGNFSETKQVGVEAGGTKTVSLQYDHPGTIPVKFKYRIGSSEEFKPSSADSIVAVHTGMLAKVLGTPGGTRLTEIQATPLFPFASEYSVYAGSCEFNKPSTGPAMPSAVVPAGAAAAPVTIQLPALNLTVWTGKNESNKGSPFSNAEVWVRDTECLKEGQPVTRKSLTIASGNLSDPGLPWGKYDLCADTVPGSPNSSGSRRQRISGVSVKNLTSGTTANFYLGSGSGTVSQSGECP
jgi:Tfp pilus assembly protein PilV